MNENEITRCKNDILYFIKKYVRIKTDDGNVPLHLTESQKRYLKKKSYKTNSNYQLPLPKGRGLMNEL